MPERSSRGGPQAAIATNTYWRSLSDEQLLDISFTTSDPESLTGLLKEVPDTSGAPPIVEYAYDFLGSKRAFIRCAHCRYPNHLAGYVVKTQTGSRFLVGHDCGDKIYGADFAGFCRDYDNARSAAEDLRRWRNLLAAFPAFFEYLTELQKSQPVRTFRDIHHTFRQNLPRVFGAIAGAFVHHNGSLSIDEQVRDFEAEERADRQMEEWNKLTSTERKKRRGEEPRMTQLPLFKFIPKVVVVLRARAFFADQPEFPHHWSPFATSRYFIKEKTPNAPKISLRQHSATRRPPSPPALNRTIRLEC